MFYRPADREGRQDPLSGRAAQPHQVHARLRRGRVGGFCQAHRTGKMSQDFLRGSLWSDQKIV